MIARELQADVRKIMERCAEAETFRRLSEAIHLLANTEDGLWDGMVSQMTISVQSQGGVRGTVTLPYDVETPLQIAVDGYPKFPRDKYFRYHLNGPGPGGLGSTNAAWDEVGQFPVWREMEEPMFLKAFCASGDDDGKELTLRVLDEDDVERNLVLVADSNNPVVSSFKVKQVLWVGKPETEGLIDLRGDDPGNPDLLLAQYYPKERTPSYRRIRLNARKCVDMIYRRRNREITSWDDWIPLTNKLAVIMALRSVKLRYEGKLEEARMFQNDAVSLLQNDQGVKNIQSPIGPQVMDYSSDWNERLRDGTGYNYLGFQRGR